LIIFVFTTEEEDDDEDSEDEEDPPERVQIPYSGEEGACHVREVAGCFFRSRSSRGAVVAKVAVIIIVAN